MWIDTSDEECNPDTTHVSKKEDKSKSKGAKPRRDPPMTAPQKSTCTAGRTEIKLEDKEDVPIQEPIVMNLENRLQHLE